MNENDIIKSLSITKQPRAEIYFDKNKVTQLYEQSVGGITELATGRKLASKISGGIPLVVAGDIEGGREESAKMMISPLIKAILIEYESSQNNELVDLTSDPARKGALHRYVGDGRICKFDQQVSPETTTLPETIALIVQREREGQQRDLHEETIVWTSCVKGRFLASIARSKWVDVGGVTSHYKQPPFGILARYESEIGGVTFLAPIWIWKDGW
jgi:hypothetical protein